MRRPVETLLLMKPIFMTLIFFILGNTIAYAANDKLDTPAVPARVNQDWVDTCVDNSLNQGGDFGSRWSVGPSVSTQLIKYDMAKRQAGFNTSVGAGASFRFYRSVTIKDNNGTTSEIGISQIRKECRQTSFGGDRRSFLVGPLFSITPTLYATKSTTEGELTVEPALLFGFFEDIINFGAGFHLTGPPGEKGNVFLLMSIGTGFSF